MAVSTTELENALAEAGISSEAAPSLAAVLQRLVDAEVEEPAQPASTAQLDAASADSTAARLDRIEQEMIHLRELLTVRFEHVDRRFEEMEKRLDQRFTQVDHRFDEMQRQIDQRFAAVDDKFVAMDDRFAAIDDRFDRERRERWGLVTAAAGAITAGLLRIFGAI